MSGKFSETTHFLAMAEITQDIVEGNTAKLWNFWKKIIFKNIIPKVWRKNWWKINSKDFSSS